MIASGIRKFVTKFDDELKFFKGCLKNPRGVGSVLPTSNITAERIASAIDINSGLPVLEIGPGTGVVTRAILARGVAPENLYLIEHFHDFVLHLRSHYAGVNIIEGDAFNLNETLQGMDNILFDSIISSVPLLNFPLEKRIKYVESLLERIPAGRPVVQLTYGHRSPVLPGSGNYTVERFHFVIRNIPPAHIWIYRKQERG